MARSFPIIIQSYFLFLICHVWSLDPVDMSTKSNYRALHDVDTPTDECRPVFLASLARHGSRTASSESKYLGPQNYLLEADSSSMLTAAGATALQWSQDLYERLMSQNEEWGGLTKIGMEEHHGLGRRTFSRFPSLFAPGSSVEVECTEVQRTQDSRDAFLRGLVDAGADPTSFDVIDPPSCDTNLESYSMLRFFDVCMDYQAFKADNPFEMEFRAVSANYTHAPTLNLHTLLFQPEFSAAKSVAEKVDFTDSWYSASCATQADSEGVFSQICSTISNPDGASLAYVADLEQYIKKGPVDGYPIVTNMSCPVFEAIVTDLDLAVDGSGKTAHLMFAHAETAIPVSAAMELLTENPFVWAGGDISKREFNGHYIAPMATNIQIILYDCGDGQDADFHVMLMHNEQIVPFPACQGKTLCPWSSAREFLSSKACSMDDLAKLCSGLEC